MTNPFFTFVGWSIPVALALAAWAVIRALRADSHRVASLRRELPKLGFRALERSDQELNERVLRLFPSASRHRTIERAWVRDNPGKRIYVADFWTADTGGGDRTSTMVTEGCVLVVAPGLHMPRFRVLPKIDITDALPAFARPWRQYVDARLGGPITMEDAPEEFGQRYTVTGEDAAAIRQFLSAQRLRELGSLKYRTLEAGGDMFVYLRREPEFPGHPVQAPDIATLVEEARLLCDVFQAPKP
jgi:hypothetical protein